jgi:hypothetical protein
MKLKGNNGIAVACDRFINFFHEYAPHICLVYFDNPVLRAIRESETTIPCFPINQQKQADIKHNHFVHNYRLPARCK